MARQTVDAIHKNENREYVAFDTEDNVLGKAGALNVHGEPVSFPERTIVEFGQRSVARVEEDMHADGVLFIE